MTFAANLPLPSGDRHKNASIDPAVVQGIRRAAHASHIDFGYLMAQAEQESGFRSDAKATSSSATGLFQFIDSTWLQMVHEHGAAHGLGQLAQQITVNGAGRPTVADPAIRAQILDLRKDPAISSTLAAEYAKSNKAEIERAIGRPANGGDLYLAHFLGAGGATELIKAVESNGSAAAADLLPEAAAANRAVFYDAASGAPRSVADLYRSFAARVERHADEFSHLDGPAPAQSATVMAPTSALGRVFGAKSLAVPLSSVFNAVMLTALKLLGGSATERPGALPSPSVTDVRRRDTAV